MSRCTSSRCSLLNECSLTHYFVFYSQAEVVKDPVRRAQFKQFVNTDEIIDKDSMIEFVDIRGQLRPADWPKDGQPQTMWTPPSDDVFANSPKSWVKVGKKSDFLPNVGSPILYGESQLAVFNNQQRGEWHCTQNMCPHKQAFVLSQGIIGDAANTPKVACPLHKKQFDLNNGEELGGDLSIITFPVKLEGDDVMVELPSEAEVNAILGTSGLRVQKSDCVDIAADALKVPTRDVSKLKSRSGTTVLQAKANNSTDADPSA